MIEERYALAVERIKEIEYENTVSEKFREYFRMVSGFIQSIDEVFQLRQNKQWNSLLIEEKEEWNQRLYFDILEEQYSQSYANPQYACERLGSEYGAILSALYCEIRGMIVSAFEERVELLAICSELFIQVYNCFEGENEPNYEEIKGIIYWYASDYSDVYVTERIEAQVDTEKCWLVEQLNHLDLKNSNYLYDFGEYVTANEISTARYLQSLSQGQIDRMAEVYVEGYRKGFITTGKDITKKSTVGIHYVLGFERMIVKAIALFEAMSLKPSIYRTSCSFVTKRQHNKVGFYGAIANKQYEYDHKDDQALFLDKKYIERKLDVMKNAYESNKELASKFGGPAVVETFGSEPFAPVKNPCAITLSEQQEELSKLYDSKAGQLTNKYIKGEERSFTIIAYPIAEIGKDYEEIFQETIKINTLDAKQYEEVQQIIINALDEGESVYIKGGNGNRTDLIIQLGKLQNPQKETNFENCVADVNIPVGEVFTSPVLKNTQGKLHVKKVYLKELQYLDLEIDFVDGRVTDYGCGNFEDQSDGKKYIKDNVFKNYDSLPMGEFAIGTNTTAYVMAKKYGIEEKLPILIAEKMGPHFAVGDTCYSWSEDTKVFNPNGKEIVARENEVSALRTEDVSKAYYNCHTDITIPYEELEEISVLDKTGNKIQIIKQGRFVLAGTEILNEPMEKF